MWVSSSEKSAFAHAQNVRIHIILHMRKVSSGRLFSIGTFYKVNKWTQELIQSDPYQVLNIKGKDRQPYNQTATKK